MQGGSKKQMKCVHQAAFDVRWCRGPVGEKIIRPWAEQLMENGVHIATGQLVESVLPDSTGKPNR